MRAFLLSGGINAFIAVALGAFGAHGLKRRVDPELLAVWQTAVEYQFGHALALLLVALLLGQYPRLGMLHWSGWAFTAGCVVFSGSLYLLVLSGQRWLGAITPIGGLAFLLGWAIVCFAALRQH